MNNMYFARFRFFSYLLAFVASALTSNSVVYSQAHLPSLISNFQQDSAERTQSPLPAPKGFVNDFAGILDATSKAALEKALLQFKDSAKVELSVVSVETTGEQSIFDYSLAVARGWQIGTTNPDKAGVLLLIAVNDKRWQIQITQSLEKVLSNERMAEIGSLMNPSFREKRYAEGIERCIDALLYELLKQRNSSAQTTIESAAIDSMIDSIAESHIEGNVPEGNDFDAFLKRDLTAYFKERNNRVVTVEYEFLRNAPTQTGIAYPKFYAWIKIYENKNLIDEGAVRLAAIEKKRFEVTDYVSKKEVQTEPEKIYKIFPRAVADKIKGMTSASGGQK